MTENMIHRLIPHQNCLSRRIADGIDISGSADLTWILQR